MNSGTRNSRTNPSDDPHIATWVLLFLIPFAKGAGQETPPYREEIQRALEYCHSEFYKAVPCMDVIKNLEQAITSDPSLVDVYMVLAMAYRTRSLLEHDLPEETRDGLKKKARIMVRKAVTVDPKNVEAYKSLIWNYVEDPGERLALARKFVAAVPDRFESHETLADLLIRVDKVDETIAALRRSLELRTTLDHNAARGPAALADTLAEKGHVKGAAEIYEKIFEKMKNRPRGERCIVLRLIELDRFQDFPQFAFKMEKLRPYCTGTDHGKRSAYLEIEGKIDEAINELELQLEENHYLTGSYIDLARLYRKVGNTGKARESVRHFLEVETDPTERCYRLITMHRLGYERFAPKIMAQLKKECKEQSSPKQ